MSYKPRPSGILVPTDLANCRPEPPRSVARTGRSLTKSVVYSVKTWDEAMEAIKLGWHNEATPRGVADK
jgi:hypothetical protein